MVLSQYKSIVEKCVREAKVARSHPAKLVVLQKLLRELFGVELIELLPGIEKKLGSKIYGFRGRADLLFHSVVFEIKTDLKRELNDAKNKLRKYFQALLEAEGERRYVGIATDVIEFKAYIPVVRNGQVTGISEIGSLDLSKMPIEDAILWLDSYIFSKERIRPTADDLKFRFGPGSPTYSLVIDAFRSLWDEVKDDPSVKLKFNLWAKNMEIVYGSSPREETFIDQTYLVTLVKLIVYYRLSGDNMVKADQIKKVLTGEYFHSYGILNLIEEDFFAWILHPKIADQTLALMCDLAKELLRYDMSKIDEDLFKEIYQEIVKRSERHRIGEYYTPEWLVELTLKEAFKIWFERNKDKDAPRILDPACGSGTFLCNAIHIIRNILGKKGKQPTEILDFILNNIVGIDINPLAVTIARANYLIALGELLKLGKNIVIPVYVSDSIKLPAIRTTLSMVEVYEIAVNGYIIQVPSEIAKNRYRLGRVLSGLREALNIYRRRRNRTEARAVFNRIASEISSKAELEVLNMTLDTLFELVDKQLDEIWIYMLNNIYAPIALKEAKFDILMSNPPWIAMRYIENKNYQDWVKREVLNYGLLTSDQVKLFSNMEIATLFFNRSADLYLDPKNGLIAFVMPRSVLTGALHHANFKQFRKPKMKLIKILDCEDVTPLFNVPSCVLIAIMGELTRYPVSATLYKGRLERKNCKLTEAMRQLKVKEYMYQPPKPIRYSYYYDKFKVGAWLAPRPLWFIDFKPHPVLGINVTCPYIETAGDVEAKERWRDIHLKGNVESDFVYVTILSKDLIPFGLTKVRPVVLPIKISSNKRIRLLTVEALRNNGFTNIAAWLEKCERLWRERRTKRDAVRFPSILDRLDYNNLLSTQDFSKPYSILYGASGTNLVSCVINKEHIPTINILNVNIKPKGYIFDVKTWYYDTNDENEAHYLCAFLNSNVINNAIKPLQTKGLFKERDIHRRPFMFPIPKFDPDDPIHLRLAELSKICHEKVTEAKSRFTGKSVASLRRQAREVVKEELKEIDKLVSQLLGVGGEVR